MRTPIILINFKAYKKAVGERALKLAKTCQRVAKRYDVNIAVAPQAIDLDDICEKTDIPVFAQHIDDDPKPGAHTGHIVAANLKKIGVEGTLVNHSEMRIPLPEIKKSISIAKKNNLVTCCCAPTVALARDVKPFRPDFIAFEVPELIGSGKAISEYAPNSVKRFVKLLERTKIVPLCGAGISKGEDVKAALELGTKGVLVASGVVKARYPENVLKKFALAMK